MDKLPSVESDFNQLSNLYFGTVASRVLITAIGMKVFDHLERPLPSEEMAQALATDPGNTELMLDALCACHLVRKKNGIYRNCKLASEFLVCDKPTYLGEWFEQADASSRLCLESLADRIRFGPGEVLEEGHMNAEAYCERYTAAHAATSLAGIARQIAEQVAGVPGFSACRSMLDLGGGPGINAMAVVSTNDRLEATVFDRPGIVRLAERYIKKYGFSNRVKTVGGNYLKDPLEKAYDLILITDSLYYEDREVDPVLNKCYAALNPGGMLVGIHAVLTCERTSPAHLVLDLLPEAVNGQAHIPDKGFLALALDRCGFDNISSRMVTICGNPMEMNVGYTKESG